MPTTEAPPYVSPRVQNARDAIATHIRWKITLLTALSLREGLSERATFNIENPDQCRIREWLNTPPLLAFRSTPEYRAVASLHRDFHREMQRIARLLNTGEFSAAEPLMLPTAPFETTSSSLAHALMALDRLRHA
jgi:hypothetical protein